MAYPGHEKQRDQMFIIMFLIRVFAGQKQSKRKPFGFSNPLKTNVFFTKCTHIIIRSWHNTLTQIDMA